MPTGQSEVGCMDAPATDTTERGAAWGKAPEVKIVTPPDTITVSVGQAVPFEASTATDDTERCAPKVQWLWDFGDKATSDKNPTTHAYGEAGLHKVTVTATTDEGTATASVEVIVTSGEGGGEKDLGDDLYLRNMMTGLAVAPADACDTLEVVFETTNMPTETPTLYRKRPVPGTWQVVGPGTRETQGVPPGHSRWVWGWLTYGERNWTVDLKVVYYKPGTAPPPPIPPPVEVEVALPGCAVCNTVVDSQNGVLIWDGTHSVPIGWTITHCPNPAPSFEVTVRIYPVASASCIRTIPLSNIGLGPGSLSWGGEQDPPRVGVAPPGVYTYTVSPKHDAYPLYCSDVDKPESPAIQNVSITDFEWVPGTHPPQARVQLHYWLTAEVGECKLEVYAPCLNQVPVSEPAGKTLPCTVGQHQQQVTFQVCPAHMGSYTLVVYARETAASGSIRRGQSAKYLRQRGTAIAIWPPAYAGAGEDGQGGPYSQDLAMAVADAEYALSSERAHLGAYWASASGVGPGQADDVFEKMDLGPVSVLFTASHASKDNLGFESQTSANHRITDVPWPGSQFSHALSSLAGDDLSETVFVMFEGCHTSQDLVLCNQVLAHGGLAFAGFDSVVHLPFFNDFARGFWYTATEPTRSIQDARDDGLNAVRRASGGPLFGFDTMFCSDWGLELFPPRFQGNCVGAAP